MHLLPQTNRYAPEETFAAWVADRTIEAFRRPPG
jgi:hypothetical protein